MFVYILFFCFIHQFADCISVSSDTFALPNFIFFLPLNLQVKLCYGRFSKVITIHTGYTEQSKTTADASVSLDRISFYRFSASL